MFRLLKFLFTGDSHVHQYEFFRQNEVYYSDPIRVDGKVIPHKIEYINRCTVCGKMKNFRSK